GPAAGRGAGRAGGAGATAAVRGRGAAAAAGAGRGGGAAGPVGRAGAGVEPAVVPLVVVEEDEPGIVACVGAVTGSGTVIAGGAGASAIASSGGRCDPAMSATPRAPTRSTAPPAIISRGWRGIRPPIAASGVDRRNIRSPWGVGGDLIAERRGGAVRYAPCRHSAPLSAGLSFSRPKDGAARRPMERPAAPARRPSAELGDDLGGEALHLLEVVEQRVEQDHLRPGPDHRLQALDARLRRAPDRHRREVAHADEEAVEPPQGGRQPLPGPVGVVVDGDIDTLGDAEPGGTRLGQRLPDDGHLS